MHLGFDGVNGEHGHVLHHAGGGAGDHELREVESIVLDGADFRAVIGLRRHGHQLRLLEFRGGVGGHGRPKAELGFNNLAICEIEPHRAN